MNKIIKFRGLDSLGNWVFGIPQTSTTLHLTLDCIAQYFTEQRKYGRQNVTVNPETVGQFTGLTDKNGIEIYYGDILKTVTGKLMVVDWSENFASFVLNRSGWAFSHWFGESCNPEDCEVVGNKYQNPDLLQDVV